MHNSLSEYIYLTFVDPLLLCFITNISSDGLLRRSKLGMPNDYISLRWFRDVSETWKCVGSDVLREMATDPAAPTVGDSEWNNYSGLVPPGLS